MSPQPKKAINSKVTPCTNPPPSMGTVPTVLSAGDRKYMSWGGVGGGLLFIFQECNECCSSGPHHNFGEKTDVAEVLKVCFFQISLLFEVKLGE